MVTSSAQMGLYTDPTIPSPVTDEEAKNFHTTLNRAEVPPTTADPEMMEDGSAFIPDDEATEGEESSFTDNIVDLIDQSDRRKMSRWLLDAIKKDKDSRKKRDELYAEGMRATGMSEEAGKGAEFDGASDVVHPLIAEGCVDFAARAIKELFPPSGPCKTKIVGKADDQKLDRAERKKEYMNWQLTEQIKEYRGELERLLSQVPLGGAQYMKLWWAYGKQRPEAEFVPIDNLYLPFSAPGLRGSTRVTHHQRITRAEFEQRVEDEIYLLPIEISRISDPAQLENESEAERANASIEGKDPSELYDEDGLRSIYEVQVEERIEEDSASGGNKAPYIVVIDFPTEEIIAVYRNWAEEDKKFEKLDHIVEFPFIPWRGAYPVGLPHLIGGMAASATGALRALLDSAHINNAPTALKIKGARSTGQSIQLDIGTLNEIEGPAGTEVDIRNLIMPLPFNPPSQTLFELLQFIVSSAQGLVGTSEEKIADASNSMPVGTTLALIEQGSVTYSAVHSRLHEAQAQCLGILHRLNAKYMDDEVTVEELGSLTVSRQDFQGPLDIIPVSDPNIFSETQRYAQLQAALGLAATYPQEFAPTGLVKRALKLMNFQDAEDILTSQPQPERIDSPFMENSTAAQGNPIKGFEGQDHLMHLQMHLMYMTSPLFGGNQFVGKLCLPALMMHCTQHLILLYEEHMKAATATVQEVGGMMRQPMDETHAAALVNEQLQGPLQQLLPLMEQAQKLSDQFAPQPNPAQQDPTYMVGMAEVQRKTKLDQANLQSKAMEMQNNEKTQQQMLTDSKQQQHDQRLQDMMTLRFQEQQETLRQIMADSTTLAAAEIKNTGDANIARMEQLIEAATNIHTHSVTTDSNERMAANENAQRSTPGKTPSNGG